MRVLKNYDFFREPQMELFKARGPRQRSSKRLPPAAAGLPSDTARPAGEG